MPKEKPKQGLRADCSEVLGANPKLPTSVSRPGKLGNVYYGMVNLSTLALFVSGWLFDDLSPAVVSQLGLSVMPAVIDSFMLSRGELNGRASEALCFEGLSCSKSEDYKGTLSTSFRPLR